MVGIIIAVIAVACLVSAKNVISVGAEKYRKKGGLSRQATLAYKPVHLIFSFEAWAWQHHNLQQTSGVGFQNSSLEMERFG